MGTYLYLASILLESFSAISFTLIAFFSLREYRNRRSRSGGAVYVWLAAACAVHFLLRVSAGLLRATLGSEVVALAAAYAATGLLILPLILHLFYRNEKVYLPLRGLWRACLAALYVAASALGMGAVTVAMSAAPRVGKWAGTVVTSLIVFAALTSGALLWSSRRPCVTALERRQRRWLLFLLGILAAAYISRELTSSRWLTLIIGAIPLGFVFVITYYVERFAFFDVVIKKGAFAFLALFLLTLYFFTLAPWMLRYRLGTLTWALSVWPIMLVYPWLCHRISAWLDRLWLDRKFSPARAGKYFLSGLEGAIAEDELARRAERHLGDIFHSEAEVLLGQSGPAAGGGSADTMRAPILLDGETAGEIRIRAREQSPRFLSEDATLLASLADTFAFLLENLRLRDKRLEQEKRERELILHAQRSELKALRAQINPHFLFNALNTIAGLIPRSPERAEQTIEQLAEVFRYTLRRSDREWVRAGEELEAVGAYFDIEKARFGERIQFRIEASEGARGVRIPAMIIQTLAENAVKHGVGALSTAGVVDVKVEVSESRIRIEVRDNGPGFESAAFFEQSETGYGLRNIRERLQGYFGDDGRLCIGRDDALGMTLVSVEMPLAAQPLEAIAS
jgi:signal transduction histidine kinase